MSKVQIAFVKGNEGYSLQIWDKNGGGYRYAGPKAWEIRLINQKKYLRLI